MKVISNRDEQGRLVYTSEIIRDVVDCALGEVEGVVKYAPNTKQYKESIKVEHLGDDIQIDVYVKLHYAVNVKETASEIQKSIKGTLESMTEFRLKDVNVHVIDVEFDDN